MTKPLPKALVIQKDFRPGGRYLCLNTQEIKTAAEWGALLARRNDLKIRSAIQQVCRAARTNRPWFGLRFERVAE